MRVEVLVLSIAAGALMQAVAPDDNPCGGAGGAAAVGTGTGEIVVRVRTRALYLCEGGKPAREFRVALGSGGVGKRREGDRRTPVGAYPLGAPRKSWSYGQFVPVGYPTVEQARAGYTGDSIGVHGPPRAFVGAGLLNTAADWTAGCIAVGSDGEITAISSWLQARPHAGIRIE